MILDNIRNRKRARKSSPSDDSERRTEARAKWLFGQWLADEAYRHDLPVIKPHPWKTLVERFAETIAWELRIWFGEGVCIPKPPYGPRFALVPTNEEGGKPARAPTEGALVGARGLAWSIPPSAQPSLFVEGLDPYVDLLNGGNAQCD